MSFGVTERASLAERIARAAEPLPDIDDPAFAAAFERFADARVVLLGEASHGTSEFYRARAAISRRLIERHGFNVVAVEADWPDAAQIDRSVRHRPRRAGEERAFRRFPTWMWRNAEVDAFVRWLHGYNRGRDAPEAAYRGRSASDGGIQLTTPETSSDTESSQQPTERHVDITIPLREMAANRLPTFYTEAMTGTSTAEETAVRRARS